MNFSDFTASTAAIDTDYIVGYHAGGGAGSDRRWLRTALFAPCVTIGTDTPLGGALVNGNLLVSNGQDSSDNTVFISRYDIGNAHSDVFALRIIAQTDPASNSQLNGVQASVNSLNNHDAVGISATTNKSQGTHNAFGAFFQSITSAAGTYALAIQTDVQNNTGTAHPYAGSSNDFIGIDLVFNAGTAGAGKDSGCAAFIRNAGASAWDVGIGVEATAVKSTLIDNACACVTLWKDTGSHTNGLDFSGGTFSGSQIKLALSSLKNAANDGAAATASVAVGEVYRNGSVLMVRVS